MADAFVDTLTVIPRGLVYVAMGIVVLALARLAQDLVTPYRIGNQLTNRDNVALALSIAGYYLGVIVVFLGALYQPFSLIVDGGLGFTEDYWLGVLEVFLYSLGGIVALNVARVVVDKLVLHRFSTEKEIIEDRNAGTGAVEFGVYVGTALVVAGSISGEGGGPLTSLVFFALGMAALILYSYIYQLLTSMDVHDEIERDNTAVGVALGANLIAVGVVALKAVFGDFVGWSEGLASFAVYAVVGFGLLAVVRLIMQFVLFPRVNVARELTEDRNLGVALIEGVSVIGISLILLFAV